MILSHEKILEAVKNGQLIEKFSPDCLGGAGYDMRIGRMYSLKSSGFIGEKKQTKAKISEIETEEYTLQPGEYILVETLEKVNMPAHLVARILPRSSLFRMGCALINALVDPGFKGTLTLGLKNLSNQEFTFQKKAKFAQIVFEEVDGEAKKYEGRYQGGKVI